MATGGRRIVWALDFSLQLSFLSGGGVNAAAGVNLKTSWGLGRRWVRGVAGEREGGDIGKRVEGGGGVVWGFLLMHAEGPL